MLIGARQGFAGDAEWSNPYISDGLIAWWDGVWNVEPNNHDSSTTKWQDLCSGVFGPLDIEEAHSNYVTFNSSQKKTLSYTLPKTIEIVIQNRATNGPGFNFGGVQTWDHLGRAGCLFPYYAASGKIECYFRQTSIAGVDESISTPLSICAAFASNKMYVYRNGALVGSKNISGSFSFSVFQVGGYGGEAFDGSLHCVRFYSRALSSNEIATNFSVDKTRFKL